jgi:6-phosphofructokinase 1
MKKFGLLVSGGSAPGVNALIRSVVRAAENKRVEIVGFLNGYKGLVENNYRKLERSDTANIISLGGTIIQTSRYDDFKNSSTRQKAADNVKKLGLDGLIVCGGEGTMEGAYLLSKESWY